jgi:hypothetical protein
MPIPDRVAAGNYHFHVYDYRGSEGRGPFQLSDGQPERSNYQFYSMVQDLFGLYAAGRDKGIPGIALSAVGGVILPLPPAGQAPRRTWVLSLGDVNAPPVVITGGIHAREWIAAEMAYLVAEYLVKNYRAAPQSTYERAIQNLILSRRIHIIPILNPRGSCYTVFSTDTGTNTCPGGPGNGGRTAAACRPPRTAG